MVDRYDKTEQEYYDDKLEDNEKRAFELSQVNEISKEKPNILPYKHLVTLSQSKNNLTDIMEALKRTGEVRDIDEDKLEERVKCIKQWTQNYAPESVVFEIQEQAPEIDLDDLQIKCIKLLVEKMKDVDWTPEGIHNSFYELQEENQIPAKNFFKIIYNILLDKERGPRLGFFLATMDKEFIIQRLESY